jgi:acetyl-CoA C-acetyltransferase
LTHPDVAKNYTDTPIYITGSQQVTDDVSLYGRTSLTGIQSTQLAMQQIFKETGIGMDEIHIAEIHDCFAIEEFFFLEDSGFYKKGEAWSGIYESYHSFHGSKHIPYVNRTNELIVNTGGGLKADGHPVGATGVRQACECFKQLRGEAEGNQVDKDVNVALCHNIGGTGGIATVHLLMRDV